MMTAWSTFRNRLSAHSLGASSVISSYQTFFLLFTTFFARVHPTDMRSLSFLFKLINAFQSAKKNCVYK